MKQRSTLLMLALCCQLISEAKAQPPVSRWETMFYNDDTWKIKPGYSEPDSGWQQVDFNYSDWFVEPFTFFSSKLPIIHIFTEHELNIPDEPKLSASMGIIYKGPGETNYLSDPFNHYEGKIGIELRGNSSQQLPIKPYSIETRDSLGINLNTSLFGMPAENDWVLRASYMDHTFVRNPLAMHMPRQIDRWASRCQLVELVLNGVYQGIYIFMEKIKRDKGRLDIAKLDSLEIREPEISGGYIYEITGYHQWIDVESFVAELIVQEAMRNSDAYGWSGYFHKDRNGKLQAGPVWDFDQSAGNSSYPDNGVTSGWMFSHKWTSNTPFFWKRLYSDPAFRTRIKVRWEKLRQEAFQTDRLLAYVDSIANLLNEAQIREFERWPVLGKEIWRETIGFEERTSYQKEIDYLKSFLVERWEWMDSEIAKIPEPVSSRGPGRISAGGVLFVYPNPAIDFINFEFKTEKEAVAEIRIHHTSGRLIQSMYPVHLSPGVSKYTLIFEEERTDGIFYYQVLINHHISYSGKFIRVSP